MASIGKKNEHIEIASDLAVPVNNGERFPPIPLPPPENLTNTMATSAAAGGEQGGRAPLLENGVSETDHTFADKSLVFNDQTIRKGFIRKVFGIVLVQLLFTCGIMAFFVFHRPTKKFVQNHPEIMLVAAIINIIVLIMISCFEMFRRRHPVNLICLSIYTFTMAVLLGVASSFMDANVVLAGVGITALLVTVLALYAIQTKYDYTAAGGVIITIVVGFIVIASMEIWIPSLVTNLPIACLMAIFSCFFLIYDLQLIIGGNHMYSFDPEEYVFAALTLYVDIVRILIYVLRILQRLN
ncbi:uncharacterized protein Dana_GF13645 [Drosophila ananassae]|uniref:Uncharacterized protein n=1 Tax=Drosophila ananassae TaxID=7217 RepID=B3MGB1_DROAN|nr:protein lifeguard 1 [Drosophila ananassae]EDV37814.2 uncharacterized protein Dana_GF13645 [Drosophila ananassae]